MAMSADPSPQAIAAATDILSVHLESGEMRPRILAILMLKAAAPHLAAAESEDDQPTYEADPQQVDWNRLNRLRGIGAREPEDDYEPFTAAGPPETEIRVVPESAVAEAVAAERGGMAEVLAGHYLANITCDHDRKQDRPECACSLVDLGWHPSVGEAVQAWIRHVMWQRSASLLRQECGDAT